MCNLLHHATCYQDIYIRMYGNNVVIYDNLTMFSWSGRLGQWDVLCNLILRSASDNQTYLYAAGQTPET